MSSTPFEMLLELFGDEETQLIFRERQLVQSWIDVEVALAAAEAELGVLDADAAKAIARASRVDDLDLPALWMASRNVGYPILPLVHQLEEALPSPYRSCVHLGATTQDIMDTGLALQLRAAGKRQLTLLGALGDQFATLSSLHRETVVAARTHGRQAVPSVLGAKFAVYLSEVTRHYSRLAAATENVSVVSLFGAGGTSAAYGPAIRELRERVGSLLGLRAVHVPWHVARDSVATFAAACTASSSTAARFAREVIDLSRTEIGEWAEADGYLRGASSAMPQKQNPIRSEAVVGAAATAQALSSAMYRAMEAGHERSAGEWQIEWQVLPQIVCLCGSALANAVSIASELRVFPDRMRQNLRQDGGLLLAEPYMTRLTAVIGRAAAHDLVYRAAREVRMTGLPLIDVLRALAPDVCQPLLVDELDVEREVGYPDVAIDAALADWRARVPAGASVAGPNQRR